jgi:hypothetical protein
VLPGLDWRVVDCLAAVAVASQSAIQAQQSSKRSASSANFVSEGATQTIVHEKAASVGGLLPVLQAS